MTEPNGSVALLMRASAAISSFRVPSLALRMITIPKEEKEGDDIFARDPLVGKFRFLDRGGTSQNDIVVVAVHL